MDMTGERLFLLSPREASPLQNGWIFRKVPKGGGGHFRSKNLCCRFLPLEEGYFGHEFRNKSATWFSENEGGGVKGRSELFRKFIRFGEGKLPLWQRDKCSMNLDLSADTGGICMICLLEFPDYCLWGVLANVQRDFRFKEFNWRLKFTFPQTAPTLLYHCTQKMV